MRTSTPALSLALIALSLLASGLAAGELPEYSVVVPDPLVTEVGDLDNVIARIINERGQAAGQAHGKIPRRIAGAAFRYTPGVGLEDLDPFGEFNSASWLINGSGLMVGSDFGGPASVFVHDGSSFDFIAEGQSDQFRKRFEATAINDSGVIVGSTGYGLFRPQGSWRYTPGVGWEDFASVDARLGRYSSALLVNNRGDVVFTYEPELTRVQALLLEADGDLLDMGHLGRESMSPVAMNESGQVVGYGATGSLPEVGFLFTPGGGLVEILRAGFRGAQALHVTPAGVVAGIMKKKRGRTYDTLFVRNTSGETRTVVRRRQFRRLSVRSGFEFKTMEVGAINDRLEFVGALYRNDRGVYSEVAFLYSEPTGLVSLQDVLDAAGMEDWTATAAMDINNAGQILLLVTDGARRTTAILTPVE